MYSLARRLLDSRNRQKGACEECYVVKLWIEHIELRSKVKRSLVLCKHGFSWRVFFLSCYLGSARLSYEAANLSPISHSRPPANLHQPAE